MLPFYFEADGIRYVVMARDADSATRKIERYCKSFMSIDEISIVEHLLPVKAVADVYQAEEPINIE